MSVPLLDLNAQNLPLEAELTAAFERVLRSGRFILGSEVLAFEEQVAELVESPHAIGVSSGTDGLLVALMALEIGPGDEVLCPTFTFFATAGCVARVGARPVFVDSCPVCFNLDPEDAARKVTPATKAIIPVHLFGQPAGLEAVLALAERHGLRVIEDAAQALGAASKGRKLGTLGDFGVFSLFPSKNLGGFGDGGIVVCNEDGFARRVRRLRAHGAEPKYFVRSIGGNFRLDPLQAALLSVKLPKLPEYNRKRAANAAYYTSRLREIPGAVVADVAACLCRVGIGGRPPDLAPEASEGERIVLPVPSSPGEHIWNQYTIRVPGGRRDALRSFLKREGIETEIYYPVPLHRQVCFADLPQAGEPFPHATRLTGECVSLPIYPELTDGQLDEVTSAIAAFLGEAAHEAASRSGSLRADGGRRSRDEAAARAGESS